MRKLPIGTVTLLFTDIEGSTRLLQRLGESYAQVLREHRRLLRAAFEQWHGYEVDTQGDAFFVVFERAVDAVCAARSAQQAIFETRWPDEVAVRVRMGLHTGEPQPTEEGYIGLDVHRAARIMSIAHGGQVLLSRETYELVAPDLPPNVSARDLGAYRLKDIGGPYQLFQLVMPGLPAEFPPLPALSSRRPLRNLPAPSTSFVGREQEVGTVCDLLRREQVRLLTLLGTAGVGKTRLALRVASRLAQEAEHSLFGDGMAFVALDQVSEPEGVIAAIAGAINVQEEKGYALFERVKLALQDQSLLLILDNFEQVVAARTSLVELLTACPGLKALVTSRSMLHVQAEHIFEVPSLALPVTTSLSDVERLSQCASIELFVQRARAVQPGFRLTPDNAPAIAQLCTRLDGIPLAIELAAARVRRFAPHPLLARLERGLAVLSGEAQDLPERQRTLRGAIAWSYHLLNGEEQRLFRRLAVFAGEATREAAAQVCASAGSVPDMLEALVDKSMLQRREDVAGKGETRYRLLQTLREYGLECLVEAGEMESARAAHAAYFLAWAERAAPLLSGATQTEQLDLLGSEYENLRSALEWLLERCSHETGRAEEALRLSIALTGFWEIRGYLSEGLSLLERALAASENASAAIRAQALHEAGTLALMQDDSERAAAFLRQSQALFRESGDRGAMAHILSMQGNLARARNAYKLARRLLEEALSIYRELGDMKRVAATREAMAQVAIAQADYSGAISLLEKNLARYKASGEQYRAAYPLSLLARTRFLARGDLELARAQAEESLALFKAVGNRRLTASVLGLLGQIALAAHEGARSRALLEESASAFEELADRSGRTEALITLARLSLAEGNLAQAYTLYNESLELLRGIEARELHAACLEGFGELLVAQGEPERAVQHWALAASIRAAIVAPTPPVYRVPYVQAVTTARERLGEERFLVAWNQGRALSLEQVQPVAGASQ